MSTASQPRLFGTDGIRGAADRFPLDPETVTAIGWAIGELLGGEILVGQDPRESSPGILEHLSRGLGQAGAVVRNAGVLPTPAIALLTRQSPAAGGVMISASHNAFEDNGIKVFGPNGQKLDDSDEARVGERVYELLPRIGTDGATRGKKAPRPTKSVDREAYLAALRSRFPQGRWLTGFRIALDCANGATSAVAPQLFESLGATVHTIHASPDGRNINAGCGAVHPQGLIDWVRQHSVDLGVAYDGDGDRSMFVSSGGRLIDGDGVLLVLARILREQHRLTPPEVVGTSMTNFALEQRLSRWGVQLARVEVGDRYVFRRMLQSGSPLGGEPSGHIIFPDFGISGDGLLTSLKLCEALITRGAPLDELTRDWTPAPQLLRNLRVASKVPLETLPAVTIKIHEINDVLNGRGRIVVRYSGTESLLRIMIESDSAGTNEVLADDLTAVVRQAIPE